MAQASSPTAEVRLRAHVRPAQAPDALPRSYGAPETAAGPAPDLADSNLHPALAAFLQAMSDKLDMLVGYLSQAQLQSDYSPAEVLEIGEHGLALAKAGNLAPGQPLEVVVVLSDYPLQMATAVGVVGEAAQRQGEPVHLFRFTRIREEDLERIVQFVFKEERARIRRNKWGE